MNFFEDLIRAARAMEALEVYNLLLMIFTAVLAISTVGLWVVTWRASRQTARAATAAEEANKLSRAVFTVGNRPWVTATVFLATPLTHTSEDGWHLQILYTLQNIGSSPAAEVRVTAMLIPWIVDAWTEDMLQGRSIFEMPTLGTDSTTELKKMAEGATATPGARFGFTLFPDQKVSELHGIYTSKSALFERAKQLQTYSGHLHLLFCASYGFTFDQSRHVTAKAFTIYKQRDSEGKWGKISLNGEHINQDNLVLSPVPLKHTDFAT